MWFCRAEQQVAVSCKRNIDTRTEQEERWLLSFDTTRCRTLPLARGCPVIPLAIGSFIRLQRSILLRWRVVLLFRMSLLPMKPGELSTVMHQMRSWCVTRGLATATSQDQHRKVIPLPDGGKVLSAEVTQ